ncbi:MAG: DUF1385 domain-containing protein [Deltaproteobacteria bacterium]|nr:DUF1385 domain-containing protein [Deltaproteobacteria bacterium]
MTSAEPKELVLGGQAVIEGVMMKGPELFAVAVRKASGEIKVRDFPLTESPARKRFAKVPLVRGVWTMAAMLVIGYKALQFSADEAIADEEGTAPAAAKEGGGLEMAGAMAMALVLAVGLFFLLPLYATHLISGLVSGLEGSLAFNLVDGAIRVLVFVLYIVGISLMKDIRRIFEYHGAEHKVIHAYEGKADLTPESVKPFSRLHPRCGTSFLLFVMVISILVFSLIPRDSSLLMKALLRLPLIPAIAGISYEVLRLSARKTGSPLFRAVMAPGLWFQRLTTREPDLRQIEVAIASFRRVSGERATEAGLVG